MNRKRVGFACLLFLLAISAAAQTIDGCVDQKGALRIVRPNEPCDSKEYSISWSSAGSGAPSAIGTIAFGPASAADIYQFSGGGVEAIGDTSGGGGAGTGKPEFSPIVVVRQVDSASPGIFLSVATGRHLPSARITLAGGARTLLLSDVLITGWELTRVDGAQPGQQFELITIDWRRIQLEFDGETACYDRVAARPC